MVSQKELSDLIDFARKYGGAIIRTWVEDGVVTRVQIRRGIPNCGREWMPAIKAAEVLREFNNGFLPVISPAEQEAIASVKALGKRWGYGNLIHHLRDAWSAELQAEWAMERLSADRAAGHLCVWCDTDHRTGQKVPIKEQV